MRPHLSVSLDIKPYNKLGGSAASRSTVRSKHALTLPAHCSSCSVAKTLQNHACLSVAVCSTPLDDKTADSRQLLHHTLSKVKLQRAGSNCNLRPARGVKCAHGHQVTHWTHVDVLSKCKWMDNRGDNEHRWIPRHGAEATSFSGTCGCCAILPCPVRSATGGVVEGTLVRACLNCLRNGPGRLQASRRKTITKLDF